MFRASGPEEQLEDLQRRFTLLEGERKAFRAHPGVNSVQSATGRAMPLPGHI